MNSTDSAIKRFEEIHGPLCEMSHCQIRQIICKQLNIKKYDLPELTIKELGYPGINN